MACLSENIMILLWLLMPLFLVIGLPLLVVLVSGRVALLAKSLAKRQREGSPAYPVAEMLETTFEPEPEGVWPPSPTVDPPGIL